jgi:hypothetical protein
MRQGRTTPVWALLASVLAHAGFLALASWLPRRVPVPAPPIEFELVAPAPAVPASPPAPLPSPTPRPAVARRAGRTPPVRAREVGPVPAERTAPAGRETVLRERAPDLAPRWPAPAEGEVGGPPGTEAAREPGDLARRIRELITAEVPFRKAREAADPYWLGVRAHLARAFAVPAELVEGRPGGGFGGQLQQSAYGYLAEAARYGETGDPRTDLPEAHAPHGAALADPDAVLPGFDSSERRRIEPDDSAARLVTWIRVAFAPDGAVEALGVERSSGVPAHDRLALEAVRELPRAGPRPADQAVTVWAFETALWIVPPLPVAGCAFDATFAPSRCFYPTKRMVRNTVRLEALP